MMRHSTLELTGRYTRPRAVDIENAASMLPSLKPADPSQTSHVLAMTGTDGPLYPRRSSNLTSHDALNPENSSVDTATNQQTLAPSCIHFGDVPSRDLSSADVMAGSVGHRSANKKTPGIQGFDASSRLVSSVPKVGLEPTPPLQGPDFESGASAIPPLRLGLLN